MPCIISLRWRFFDPAQNQNMSKALAVSMRHCSDMVTFDYLCDNDDRSPNKNNHVVGGCESCKPDHPPHPGPPNFVHLDQGSGFYHSGHGYLDRNALRQRHKVDYCTFRRPLLTRMQELSGVEKGPGLAAALVCVHMFCCTFCKMMHGASPVIR